MRTEAYAGCPALTWLIASRVCNPYEDQDAFISFTGRKGSGKSTASLAFCEALAEDISRLRGKGECPSQFFNIEHVRSITETGAVDLLSSGILKQENSVILLDDTGTQWGARNFTSTVNKTLNAILQICRVYRCVLIANFIMKSHVDIQARGMTDFRAEMQYKDVSSGQAFFKFYYLENTEYGEYRKFLTWHGKRVKLWMIEKPSEGLNSEYQAMRRKNTDSFIEEAREKVMAKIAPGKKTDGRIRDYGSMPIVIENAARCKELLDAGNNLEQIARDTGLTRYWVERCLSVNATSGGETT